MGADSENKKKGKKKRTAQTLALNYKINCHQVYIITEPFDM